MFCVLFLSVRVRSFFCTSWASFLLFMLGFVPPVLCLLFCVVLFRFVCLLALAGGSNQGARNINLKGMGIGNGLTSPAIQYPYYTEVMARRLLLASSRNGGNAGEATPRFCRGRVLSLNISVYAGLKGESSGLVAPSQNEEKPFSCTDNVLFHRVPACVVLRGSSSCECCAELEADPSKHAKSIACGWPALGWYCEVGQVDVIAYPPPPGLLPRLKDTRSMVYRLGHA